MAEKEETKPEFKIMQTPDNKYRIYRYLCNEEGFWDKKVWKYRPVNSNGNKYGMFSIEMPDFDSIDLAKEVVERIKNPIIVYL